MAQRRMFSKQITDTDVFLDMPATAQNLYFHLNMHADDDGFLGNAKTIRRMIGASEDDLKVLVAKQFILIFPDGVAVIRDWHIHNYIQKDRYHPTVYEKDKQKLKVNNTKQYELQLPKKPIESAIQEDVSEVDTSCIQDDNKMDTEVRLGKVRLGKSKNNKKGTSQSAEPIPYKGIIDYLNKKTNKNLDYTTPTYQRIIRGRWHDKKRKNLTIEQKLAQFKKVIDNKAFDWQGDKVMWKYMRPSTLFAASHFDEYLNENNLAQHQPASGGYGGEADISGIPDDDLPF